MRLLNYSHPLSTEAAATVRQLVGDFEEILLPNQIDFEAPVGPQLERLVEIGDNLIGDDEVVLYIPPALSFSAAYVTRRLGWRPMPKEYVHLRMVVLKATAGPIHRYIIGELVDIHWRY